MQLWRTFLELMRGIVRKRNKTPLLRKRNEFVSLRNLCLWRSVLRIRLWLRKRNVFVLLRKLYLSKNKKLVFVRRRPIFRSNSRKVRLLLRSLSVKNVSFNLSERVLLSTERSIRLPRVNTIVIRVSNLSKKNSHCLSVSTS